MQKLTIVADENIPMAEALFAPYGNLIRLPGRDISSADLKNADALIVRSVTKVDKNLLSGSTVKFVGSCTIGVDHLDVDYLRQQKIAYTSAPGCNANSVVEYVFSVLAHLRPQWLGAKVGIIGMGNVGSALYRRLHNLGIEVLAYDPLINQDRYPVMTSLEAVLNCDVISMHAPITAAADYPSYHMIGAEQLQRLRPGALLINAGRGACIDNKDLLEYLKQRPGVDVVLDVWEPEPAIDLLLLPYIALATPHIAGYSHDGRLNGSTMIVKSFCRYLQQPLLAPVAFAAEVEEIIVLADSRQKFINQAILNSYNVLNDDLRLRKEAERNPAEFPQAFDAMRKKYPKRLEFFHRKINTEGQQEKKWLDRSLAALGYAQ